MSRNPISNTSGLTRRAALYGVGAAGLAFGVRPAFAAEKVRIGVPGKTWWPTVIAETAASQGLFKKVGIEQEITVYRSGGEAIEALAAGAADVTIGLPSQIGTGRMRGVNAKIVGLGSTANTGWKLLVTKASPIQSIADLAGKKVGITAAGSLSDFMALWSRSHFKIDFTSIPLGGGGLVPNLLSGNVDAAIVYSPLSFQLLQKGQAREIVDYMTAIPPHLNAGWAAMDATIAGKKDMLKKTLEALYGAVVYLQKNPDAAIKVLSEVNGIEAPVAKQEYEETILKLSSDGRMTLQQAEVGLDLARIGGFQNLAPAADIFTDAFTPVVPAT